LSLYEGAWELSQVSHGWSTMARHVTDVLVLTVGVRAEERTPLGTGHICPRDCESGLAT